MRPGSRLRVRCGEDVVMPNGLHLRCRQVGRCQAVAPEQRGFQARNFMTNKVGADVHV